MAMSICRMLEAAAMTTQRMGKPEAFAARAAAIV
jgi:hypothetical protein